LAAVVVWRPCVERVGQGLHHRHDVGLRPVHVERQDSWTGHAARDGLPSPSASCPAEPVPIEARPKHRPCGIAARLATEQRVPGGIARIGERHQVACNCFSSVLMLERCVSDIVPLAACVASCCTRMIVLENSVIADPPD
jgi:hypothetical protein